MLLSGHSNSPAFKEIMTSLPCLGMRGDSDIFLLSSFDPVTERDPSQAPDPLELIVWCLSHYKSGEGKVGRGVNRSYKGHKDKIKGEGRGGGGRWDWLGWGRGKGKNADNCN